MSLTALFDKLQEHELDLNQLEQQEELKKKGNITYLKDRVYSYETSQYKDSYDGNIENMNLLVKKFNMFLRKNKAAKFIQVKRFMKSNEASI
ncbi:hypothetical protein Lal_00016959 [Lupinus albus]|nr:hypothetical protein Lal_00016959 [Lupinus albus]